MNCIGHACSDVKSVRQSVRERREFTTGHACITWSCGKKKGWYKLEILANSSPQPATNGVASAPPARASPAPQGPAAVKVLPNGSGAPPQSVASKDPKAAAQAAAEARNIVRRKLTGYVGFANLPNQWHRKSVRKGFNFNVMVVGKFFDEQPKGVFRTLCKGLHHNDS